MFEDEETKAERFVRLAKARVPRALKRIKLIGNLAGPGYEYTDEQTEKVLDALQGAVDRVRDKFQKDTEAEAFEL